MDYDALKASEERFRQIAEVAAGWIWEVDADGLYTYASPTVEKVLGYRPEELVGKKHFYDLFAGADRAVVRDAALAMIRLKQPFRNFPNANLDKWGRQIELLTSGAPILGPSGELRGYRGADQDVTTQVRAEEELRRSETMVRSILETAMDGVVACDIGNRIVLFNSAAKKMLGYSAKEVAGRDAAMLFPPEDRASRAAEFETAEAGHLNLDLLRADGTRIPCEITFSKTGPGQEPLRIIILRDLTERRKAEGEIRKNEMKYRALFEEAGDYILILSFGDKRRPVILDANQAALDMHGYTRDELIGQPIWVLDAPGGFERNIRVVGDMTKPGDSRMFETVHVRKDGTTFPVEVSARILQLGDDEPFLISIERDISARKIAEEGLRARGVELETLVDNSPDVIVRLGPGESILLVNGAFERLTGLAQEKILYRSLSSFSQHPPLLGQVAVWFHKVWDTGKEISGEYVLPGSGKKEDSRAFDMRAVPEFSKGGPIISVLFIFREVTATRRVEEFRKLLHESVLKNIRFLQRVVASIPSAVLLLDDEMKIIMANQRAVSILQVTEPSLIGTSAGSLFQEEPARLIASHRGTTLMRQAGGSLIEVGFSSASVNLGEESKEGSIIVFQDLTETNQLREELRRKDRIAALGSYVATIAHELRNPLFGISSITQVLKREMQNPEHLELLSVLASETQRTAALLDELLRFGSAKPLVLAPTDPCAIAHQQLAMLRPLLEAAGGAVTLDCTLRRADVPLDGQRISQLFANLLGNAVKAPGVTRIGIRNWQSGERLYFEIENDGEPVPQEIAGTIFEPFISARKGGVGLGLAISKQIVEDHGGAIQIESDAAGTRVRFWFPLEVKQP